MKQFAQICLSISLLSTLNCLFNVSGFMILLLFIFSLGTKKMIDIVKIFFLVTDLGWHKHMRKRKKKREKEKEICCVESVDD